MEQDETSPIPHNSIETGDVATVTTTKTDGDTSDITVIEAKAKHTATLARASVTIAAIIASVVVAIARPDAAGGYVSIAVGAISGFFAISRNSDKDATT